MLNSHSAGMWLRIKMSIKRKKLFKEFLKKFKKNKLSILVILLLFISFSSGILTQRYINNKEKENFLTPQGGIDLTKIQEEVIPKKGYSFKIHWGDLGKRMVEDGVIDKDKFTKAVTGSDNLPANLGKYLDGSNQQTIELNEENAQFWVDLLWGLGLANKSNVLDKGPMMEGGNTANFASTGGWTIGQKTPMELYSKFSYLTLSEKQEAKVLEIAQNIYRPCCGNSTAFPDCNHGMAALGLIELMVSQNKSNDEIYKTVLAFNSYWFPQTYLDVAYHFVKNKRDYKSVKAQEILSKTFSSSMGYQVIKKQVGEVNWPALGGAGRCGA